MESIAEQGLQPGDQLPAEGRLAEGFGVSRPVVREALRHLAALNMIELATGKAPVVKPITPDLLGTFFQWAVQLNVNSLIELHELRRGVEGACAALAAQRLTDEDRATLQALVRSMRECVSDFDAYTELDMQLHLAIAAATRNSLLRHLVDSIRVPMKQVIRTGLDLIEPSEDRLERLQHGHEVIVEAILAGDPAEARLRMEQHFDGAVARFVAAGLPGVSRQGKPGSGEGS